MTYIGIVASIFSCTIDLPQIFKTLKTKNVDSFSLISLLMRIIMLSFWFSYGIEIKNKVLIYTNIICILYAIILVMFYFKYRSYNGIKSNFFTN